MMRWLARNHILKKLYEAAVTENCKLKFVANYENGKASVGLRHIPAESDFYHLYGKDNLVLFYTDRYPEQPLVIKGAELDLMLPLPGCLRIL